eukprot:3941443-Rhodomonas_salina.4
MQQIGVQDEDKTTSVAEYPTSVPDIADAQHERRLTWYDERRYNPFFLTAPYGMSVPGIA